MNRSVELVRRLLRIGVNADTPVDVRHCVVIANGLNLFVLAVVPIWMIAEQLSPIKDPNLQQFSLLLMALLVFLALIHLFISFLGLSYLARILQVLDFPAVLFLFPAVTGHLHAQDLLWFPYLMAFMSIIPQLILSLRFELPLYLVSIVYMFLFALFADNIIFSVLEVRNALAQEVYKFRFYNMRTVISLFVFLNLTLFYFKWSIMQRDKQLERIQRATDEIHQG